MPSLVRYFWPCIEVICSRVNEGSKITYAELADELGLQLARQEWSALLDLIANKTRRELGDDYDLTWNVVYGHGRAEGLSRYFSNGRRAVGSTLLDPDDDAQVAEFERKLKKIYRYTYVVQKVGAEDRVIKTPRGK